MRDRRRRRSLGTLALLGASSRSGSAARVPPRLRPAAAFLAPPSSRGRRPRPWGDGTGGRRGGRVGPDATVGTDGPRRSSLVGSTVRASGATDGETTAEAHRRADGASEPRATFGLLPDFMQKDPLAVTKQRWTEDALNVEEEEEEPTDRRKTEMMAMSVASLALAVGVIYALASSTPTAIVRSGGDLKDFLREDFVRDGGAVERIGVAARTVVGEVLPQNAEEVIAASIGEGLAGAIGALVTYLLRGLMRMEGDGGAATAGGMGMMGMGMGGSAMGISGLESTKRYLETGKATFSSIRSSTEYELVSEAVADGDYFLTRAAAQPLLEGLGIPLFVASLASVLIATVPYETVKLNARKRRMAQQRTLLAALEEEEERRRADMTVVDQVSNDVFGFFQRLYVRRTSAEDAEDDPEEEVDPIQERLDNAPAIDYVELFADLTKWLEYDVLITNYRGVLALPNGQALATGWESAIFGLLAALSSQLYTDVLYLYSDLGDPVAREKTLRRSAGGWAGVYAAKCLSTATLFGTYEAVRGPTTRGVGLLISGAGGGCAGSSDYDLCAATYLTDNPPAATIAAQLRALAVSSIDQWENILPLNDQETWDAFVRGVAVSAFSVLDRFVHI